MNDDALFLLQLLSAVSSLARLKWTKIKSDNRYPASAIKMDGSIWVPQNCARIMFFHLSLSTWGHRKVSSCLYVWDSTTAEDNTAWWSMTNNQHDGREQKLTRMEIHFHQKFHHSTNLWQSGDQLSFQKRFRRIPDWICLQLSWETGGERGNIWEGSWCLKFRIFL